MKTQTANVALHRYGTVKVTIDENRKLIDVRFAGGSIMHVLTDKQKDNLRLSPKFGRS